MINPINVTDLKKTILTLDKVTVKYPFSKKQSVFYYKEEMFAIVNDEKLPFKISLRCDWRLSNLLKSKYEEVLPGVKLDEKKWITILLTGQLEYSEIKDLIRHAYELVAG